MYFIYYKMKYRMCSDKIHQGGAVAAPVAGKVLGEVLPYLELKQDNEETIEKVETVVVPDITYKTLKEAESIIKESKLELEYSGEIDNKNKENYIIKKQFPSAGITINTNNKIKVEI